MPKKEVLEAIATLVGTVIGAGVLGIPYVVAQAGLLTGIVDIVLLGIAVAILYLYYGEVVLRTKKIHQLSGYAEKYLGKTGKAFATFSMIIGIYGAMIAYIIGVGASLSALLGGSSVLYSIIFFVIASLAVYIGLKAVERFELVLMVFVLLSILVICGASLPSIQSANLTGFNIANILAPYGVILFAFLGTAAIPEMREELKGNEKKLKSCITLGMIVPIIIYALFSFVVVGVVGIDGFGRKDIATIALSPFVGSYVAILGNVFAVLAMATSFLALALALQEMWVYDFKLNKNIAFVLTCSVPLAISLSNITGFIETIGIAGVVVGAINAVLVVLMHWKAKQKGNRKPEYELKKSVVLGVLLMLAFILGSLYKLLALFFSA